MITTGEKFRFTPRMGAYSIVLVALLSVLVTLVAMRSDIQATITKMPGTSFKQNEQGNIENIYTIKLVNKTQKDKTVTFAVRDQAGTIKMVNGHASPTVKAEATLAASFVVEIKRSLLTEPKKKLYIDVLENGKIITSKKIYFSGPF